MEPTTNSQCLLSIFSRYKLNVSHFMIMGFWEDEIHRQVDDDKQVVEVDNDVGGPSYYCICHSESLFTFWMMQNYGFKKRLINLENNFSSAMQ